LHAPKDLQRIVHAMGGENTTPKMDITQNKNDVQEMQENPTIFNP
jgi:hypothetical protein